jgi:hypothetical protein
MVGRDGRGKKAVRNGDFWLSSARDWGEFQLAIDTEPPHIKYLYPRTDKQRKAHQLRFSLSDNMTSIKRYNGYIDGAWALFELRNGIATYRIDYTRVKRNKQHKVRFVAEDDVGNVEDMTFDIYF